MVPLPTEDDVPSPADETVHRFAEAGHYLVRVEGTGHGGMKA
jgi:hypothetical protein